MKTFLEYVIKALVDHPEEVCLTDIDGDKTAVFELRCHQNDMGKVIGKSGKTIGAIRVLLSTLGARQGRRTMIEVVE